MFPRRQWWFFLNGTIYFLIHKSIHLDIPWYILFFAILTWDSYSATSETLEYQVRPNLIFFGYTRPPYWIRHFVFCHFEFRFVISNRENFSILIFVNIKDYLHIFTMFLGFQPTVRRRALRPADSRHRHFPAATISVGPDGLALGALRGV